MTDHDDTDVENRLSDADEAVLASRRAAATGRTGTIQFGTGRTVTQMPCRRCRKPVDATEECIAAFEGMNKLLRAKGQVSTLPDQVLVCEDCRRMLYEHAANNARKVCDRMAAAVRTLKAGRGGEEERQAVEYLNKHDNLRAPGNPEESESVWYWREYHKRKRGDGGRPEW